MEYLENTNQVYVYYYVLNKMFRSITETALPSRYNSEQLQSLEGSKENNEIRRRLRI